MGRLRILLVIAAAMVAALAVPVPEADAASVITVSHNQLLRDGLPWVPRGVQIVGLVAPDDALSGKYVAAHQQYGYAELQAAVAAHADLIRFQVSQFGLDPQGPLSSPAYADEVANAVQAARSLGLAVIVSLQAEPPAGEPTRCPLPDAGAERAWESLSAQFAGDEDVMFELYNEPGVSATPAGWIQWRAGGEIIYPGGSCQAVGMQTLISDIRARAPENVIIVPGLGGEQSLAGRMRIVDPAHRADPQLAFGVHYPSLARGIGFWDRTFGTASAAAPIIVTEWNANSTTSCVPAAPSTAPLLLDYLASKRIGVVGFAFDLPGTIVADSAFTPTSYAGFACGILGGGPGQVLFGDFAAEAQAGDGAQPDATPAWVIGAGAVAALSAQAHTTAARFLDTPRTFVTGTDASTLSLEGMDAAVPTAGFADETRLAAAVSGPTLASRGVRAVLYAAGTTAATPPAQQRNPAHYYAMAARAAHAHGFLFIAAPQGSLVDVLAPGTPAGARDRAFLRLGLAGDTARAADAFEAPAQPRQAAFRFGAFVASAARQAARSHPGIELLADLNAGGALTQDALLHAFTSTRLTVSGYGLSGSAGAAGRAGLALLRTLERLEA